MTKLHKILISVALLLSASLTFACDYPPRPDTLPNGETATKEEMLAGVKVINEYQENMNEYLSCIEASEIVAKEAMDPEDEAANEQREQMFNKRYNAAVEEQTLTVEEFNSQIRAYKSRTN